ncbi:hypothetical protein D1007_16009 [Hordeum vulgare]|nr:hypothetical protein D1007_16009 [Hordeum vulgare]
MQGSVRNRGSTLKRYYHSQERYYLLLVLRLPRHWLTIIEIKPWLRDPKISSDAHPLKPQFILTILALEVKDLGLEMLDPLLKLEENRSHVLGVHLVISDEVCDHRVVSTQIWFNYPLTAEDLLLHCRKPGLLACLLLRSLDVMDVKHPLVHLNGLSVFHRIRGVQVDDLIK